MSAMSGPGPTAERPPLVLVAAILLFVVGGLTLLLAFLLFGLGGVGFVYGVLNLVLGAAAIYAGTQVMAARERGRVLGMALAGVGLVFGLIQLIQTGTPTIVIGLLLNGFILYALATTKAHFIH